MFLKTLWLTFCQLTTALLAVFFIVASLKPHWIKNIDKLLFPSTQVDFNARDNSNDVEKQRYTEVQPLSQRNFRLAAHLAMPTVVHVFTSQNNLRAPKHPFLSDPFLKRFFGKDFELFYPGLKEKNSLGSGVIVSENGHIITNNHVIDKADMIEVALADGRKERAEIIGTDPETDLAVLKINANKMQIIKFGETKSLYVGDPVLAIGNPFGVGQTATQGIVSALGRNELNINTFENFIQTDAAINPGNSGGALVDIQGKLVGINTAIYSQTGSSVGIGFAIPVDLVKQVFSNIATYGRVKRGYLGVQPTDIDRRIAEKLDLNFSEGTYIKKLLAKGPGAKGGLLPGDIVLRVNDTEVKNTQKFLLVVSNLSPGSKATITVLRNGEEKLLQVTVGERPKT